MELEDVQCTWKPRRLLAARLRKLEEQAREVFLMFEVENAPPALPPPRAPDFTPSKRARNEPEEPGTHNADDDDEPMTN